MTSKQPIRLLLVDDDEELGELLREYFAGFGHELAFAPTATRGRHALRKRDPDVLILDVMLPDADGMELCRAIRKESDVPILMLTARGDVADRVLGLEYGADDYLPKPFEPRELVARVETLMRRARETPAERLSAGELTLEPGRRRVVLDGHELDLTTTEFELLRVLMERRGRVMPRDTLLETLHGLDESGFDRSVDMAVSRLRAKLGDDSRSPRFIKTIRGVGYQFVASSHG